MKLFAAITFPEDIRKALVGTMHELKNRDIRGNYVSMQNLHLTMTYIGEVQSAQPVREIMSAIPFEPFRLQLTEPGHFDSTLWAGAKAGQRMKEYNHALRTELKKAEIPFSDQKFEPHVTLVRKASGAWPKGITIPKCEMMVRKISLMKSEQKNGKTVYTEIFAVRQGTRQGAPGDAD